MAQKLTREELAREAILHQAPTYRRNAPLDRSFELPTALYAVTVGLFLAFIAIMAIGFAHPQMIVPTAIFVLFITAAFVVPALWAGMHPEDRVQPLSWSHFQDRGIQTLTGRVSAGSATTQVLILPVLVVLWGIAAVTIAALVS